MGAFIVTLVYLTYSTFNRQRPFISLLCHQKYSILYSLIVFRERLESAFGACINDGLGSVTVKPENHMNDGNTITLEAHINYIPLTSLPVFIWNVTLSNLECEGECKIVLLINVHRLKINRVLLWFYLIIKLRAISPQIKWKPRIADAINDICQKAAKSEFPLFQNIKTSITY